MDRPAPPDLPDEVANLRPVFLSRRKAEQLPPLRPTAPSNGFDGEADQGWCRSLPRVDWQRGFRWGVAATIGGLCLVVALIRVLIRVLA